MVFIYIFYIIVELRGSRSLFPNDFGLAVRYGGESVTRMKTDLELHQVPVHFSAVPGCLHQEVRACLQVNF